MALKDVNERRTADRRIARGFNNLRMVESFGQHAYTHPRSPKRKRMWTFFVIGWAAGMIGFFLLLLFFR